MQIHKVHQFKPSQLNEMAQMHQQLLHESFLNNFGSDFLKIIYSNIVQSKQNICLILQDNKQLIGYAIATTNNKIFNKQSISNNFFQLILLVLVKIIQKPVLIIKLIEFFTLNPPKPNVSSELQFIAIKKSYQGQGLGEKILKSLHQEFKNKNINKYIVGTKAVNKQSNQFYLNHDFQLIETITIFGDKFNYYQKDL